MKKPDFDQWKPEPPPPIIAAEIKTRELREIVQVIEVAEGLAKELKKNKSPYDYEDHALRHLRLAKTFIVGLDDLTLKAAK